MKKRFLSSIIFILYLASSSGLVVFACDCAKYNHYRFNLMKYTICADYGNELGANTTTTSACNSAIMDCCNAEKSNSNTFQFTPVLKNFCGIHTSKTLEIKADIEIQYILLFGCIKCLPDYSEIIKCYIPTVPFQIDSLPRPPKLLCLINFIHKISSIQNDDTDSLC